MWGPAMMAAAAGRRPNAGPLSQQGNITDVLRNTRSDPRNMTTLQMVDRRLPGGPAVSPSANNYGAGYAPGTPIFKGGLGGGGQSRPGGQLTSSLSPQQGGANSQGLFGAGQTGFGKPVGGTSGSMSGFGSGMGMQQAGSSYDQYGNWLGQYGTHVPGTNIDAGDRTLGSANYGAVAGLEQMLGANPSMIPSMHAQGMVPPSFWGKLPAYYQGQYGNSGLGEFGGKGGGASSAPRWSDLSPEEQRMAGLYTNLQHGSANAMTQMSQGGGQQQGGPSGSNVNWGQFGGASGGGSTSMPRPTGGASSLSFSLGSAPGGGGSGGSLQNAVTQGYLSMLGSGGSPFTHSQREQYLNRQGDTIARGTQDSIDSARLDAIRRGDTSGSSLGTTEANIRARGSADMADARLRGDMGLRDEASRRLLAALGGASGMVKDENQLMLLLGQLEAQQMNGGFGPGLEFHLGG